MRNIVQRIADNVKSGGGRYSLKPIRALRLLDEAAGQWTVTDVDPQFALTAFPTRGLGPGYYRVILLGAKHAQRLRSPALYLDFGDGLSEAGRVDLNLQTDDSGRVFALFHLDRYAKRMRFDPTEDARVSFGASGLLFDRLSKEEFNSEARSVASRIERRSGANKNYLTLAINLHRLLPAHQGAGGAGRLALALLRYLPNFINVKAVIAPHNTPLISEFPEVEFLVTPTESYEHLREILGSCDCYFDFLNGLRPTFIPQNVVVMACLLDLQHMRLPMLFSGRELQNRIIEYGYVVDRADRLIAISEYEKMNLQRFYGVDNVSVVPLSGFAAEDYFENAVRASVKPAAEKYLIYPALPWGHKNHETLLQAIALLKQTNRPVRLVLTNTGDNSPGRSRLDEIATQFELHSQVEFRGYLAEDELIRLILGSSGLVFPSLYEGFGIPIVDAMKLGVPVLASNIPAIREIGAGTVTYLQNQRNAAALAEDVWNFWTAGVKRNELTAAAIVKAQTYSSERMAAEIAQAAKTAISDKNAVFKKIAATHLPPERQLLSVLVISDQGGDTLPAEISRIAGTGSGGDIDFTVAVDVSQLARDELKRQRYASIKNLILFDSRSIRSRSGAVQEFSRRFANGQFHLILDESQLQKFHKNQITAMLHALRQHPTALYASVSADVGDVMVSEGVSELSAIEVFESQRSKSLIVQGVMFRNPIGLEHFQHGSTAFFSRYAVGSPYIVVPAIKDH